MTLLGLARRSLWNRRLTSMLVVVAIALSVTLLLGVERLRSEARTSFANTLSGTDLIVGARSGPINLLLYSVFRLGDATGGMSWRSHEAIRQLPAVAWAVPIALGDSHRGFAVVGTEPHYFDHYRHGQRQLLSFAEGRPFSAPLEAVVGAAVARQLGYRLGQSLVLAHGTGDVSFVHHDALPFTVVGVLAATGTPVDHSIHVPLAGLEAVHRPGATTTNLDQYDLTPRTISATLLGLHQRGATFAVQRQINDWRSEPLQAILPGLTLQQLWDLMAVGERALLLISALVAVVGITVLLVALIASLNERRREIAILRAVGAGPRHIVALVLGEALLLVLVGISAGLILLQGGLTLAAPLVEGQLGLALRGWPPSLHELYLLLAIIGAALIAGLLPAWRAYRYAVADGLTQRI